MSLPFDLKDPEFQEKAAEHIRQLFVQGYICGLIYAAFDKFMYHLLQRLTYLAFLVIGYTGRRAGDVGRYDYELPLLAYMARRIVWTDGGSMLLVSSFNLTLSFIPQLRESYNFKVADRSAVVVGLFLQHAHTCIAISMLLIFHWSFRLGLALFAVLPIVVNAALYNAQPLLAVITRLPLPIRRVIMSPLVAWDYVSTFVLFRMRPQFYRFLNRIEEGRLNAAEAQISQLPKYVFEPLHEPRLFRILVVERRRFFQPPRCRLETVSLNSSSAYMACSYVWGDATLSRKIRINGRRLDITESAYNVITQQQSFFSDRSIWIDAICINQTDLAEKAVQIGHMGDIFGHALWVDAYLKFGYADADLWRIFNELGNKDTLNKAFGTTDQQMFDSYHLRPHWPKFADLLRSRWFSRAWVMQEAMLAGDLYLNYEQVRIGWPQFSTALEAMDTTALKASLSTLESMRQDALAGDLLDRPLSLTYVRRFIKRDKNTLFDILRYFRAMEATEPRDYVYALMGLAPKTASLVLPIDYNINIEVLFTRVMRWVILERGLICLLSCGTPRKRRLSLDLPSWVVDWSADYRSLDTCDIPTWRATTHIKASHELPVTSLLSKDTRLLVSMMTLDDSVGESVQIPELEIQTKVEEMNEVNRGRHSWISGSLQIVLQAAHDQTDEGIKALKDAYYRTLTYEHADPDDEETLHWDKRGFRSDYEFLEQQLNVGGDFESSPIHGMQQSIKRLLGGVSGFENLTMTQLLRKAFTNPEEFFAVSPPEDLLTNWNMEDMFRFNRILNRLKFAVGRRIGVTAGGRVASFPHNARVGDEICLIARAPAPFVVRKASGLDTDGGAIEHRELVGWCYLHGGMDGSLATGPWDSRYLV